MPTPKPIDVVIAVLGMVAIGGVALARFAISFEWNIIGLLMVVVAGALMWVCLRRRDRAIVARTSLRKPTKSSAWLLAGVCAVLAALVFFWWFVQTAWLGSFPGRDVAQYAFWAYTQLGVGLVLFVFGIFAFIKVGRTNEPIS